MMSSLSASLTFQHQILQVLFQKPRQQHQLRQVVVQQQQLVQHLLDHHRQTGNGKDQDLFE